MTIDIHENAQKFAIWRMGTQNNWECTYIEVVDATGVSMVDVLRICMIKKWRFVQDTEFQPVDFFMAPSAGIDRRPFHV